MSFAAFIKRVFGDLSKKGSFAQNLAFMTSSKTLITIGGFLFTPILSRIYSPEVYGIFAVFDAYITIGSIVATLSLQTALMLPNDEETFLDLLKAMVIASITVSFLMFPLLASDLINGLDELRSYRYVVPGIVFLTALNMMLSSWLNRNKKFKQASIRNVAVSYSSKGFNVAYGVLTKGKWDGLVLTHILMSVAQLLSNFILLRHELPKANWKFNISNIKSALNEYRRYPAYMLPSAFVERFLTRTPAFFLTPVFGLDELGLLSFAIALLDIPIRMIGENAIGVVLLQKTNELKNKGNKGELLGLYKKMYLSLFALAIPFVLLVFFFGEPLFGLVFGEDWTTSGRYAAILVIFYGVRLINTPTSSIMRILELEKVVVWLVVARILVISVSLIFSLKHREFEAFIWGWSIGYSIILLVYTLSMFSKLKNYDHHE